MGSLIARPDWGLHAKLLFKKVKLRLVIHCRNLDLLVSMLELRPLLFNLVININNFLRLWTVIWIAQLLTYRIIKYFIILLTLLVTLFFLNLTFLYINRTFNVRIHKKLITFFISVTYFIFIIFNVLWITASWYGYISVAMNYNISELVVYLMRISLRNYFFCRLIFLVILIVLIFCHLKSFIFFKFNNSIVITIY